MRYETAQVNRLGNREKNQDRVAIVENDGAILMVLADGLGGHHGGEIASQKAVDMFIQLFGEQEIPLADPRQFLKMGMDSAHRSIVDAGNAQFPPIIPRTTCVACVIQGGNATWAHIGDSRLYVYRDSEKHFRTMDHSIVEELFQKGVINEMERATHPKRHHITRCLGGDTEPESNLEQTQTLKTGDVIIMCSDGLWDPLGDEGIAEFLDANLSESVDNMAYEAENRSQPRSDNISVAGFRFLSAADERRKQQDQPAQESKASGVVADEQLQQAVEQMRESIDEFRKGSDSG